MTNKVEQIQQNICMGLISEQATVTFSHQTNLINLENPSLNVLCF